MNLLNIITYSILWLLVFEFLQYVVINTIESLEDEMNLRSQLIDDYFVAELILYNRDDTEGMLKVAEHDSFRRWSHVYDNRDYETELKNQPLSQDTLLKVSHLEKEELKNKELQESIFRFTLAFDLNGKPSIHDPKLAYESTTMERCGLVSLIEYRERYPRLIYIPCFALRFPIEDASSFWRYGTEKTRNTNSLTLPS